ncbi:putative proline-rich protein [Mycena venus]|uniref:Putative proline-rich protein n=1 Tax=Mycena venus TaxID=2733690 RepID=A0A8H6U1P2_9AGAR|nr:putative proline-rich protein [Mycena venus]
MAPGSHTCSRKRGAEDTENDADLDIQKIINSIPGAHRYFRTAAPPPLKKAKSSGPKEALKKKTAVSRKCGSDKKVPPSLPPPSEHPVFDPSDLSPPPPSPLAAGPSTIVISDEDERDELISDTESEKAIENNIYALSRLPPPPGATTLHFKHEDPSRANRKSKTKTLPKPDSEPEPEVIADEPPRKITIYVFVVKPAKPISRGKPPPPTSIQHGPFFSLSNDPFSIFSDKLARTIRCRVPAIDFSHTQWKYSKPQNDRLKSLTNKDGYEALLISLADRSKDLSIEIHLPPPLILADDLLYATDDYKPADRYDELDEVDAGVSSVQKQIQSLDEATAPVMEELHDRYKIGNHLAFPNKRVVTSHTHPDRHWELNDIRLRVWAANILQGKATKTEIPVSSHFSKVLCLRVLRTVATPAPAVAPVPDPLAPPPAPAAPSAQDLLLLLVAQHLKPSVIAQPTAQPAAQPIALPPSTPQRAPIPDPSSPAVILPRPVSIPEFCTRYSLPTTDEQKLADLEFVPGDRNIQKLEQPDWEEVGFKRLGWLRVLDAHKQFLIDIRNGSFS